MKTQICWWRVEKNFHSRLKKLIKITIFFMRKDCNGIRMHWAKIPIWLLFSLRLEEHTKIVRFTVENEIWSR